MTNAAPSRLNVFPSSHEGVLASPQAKPTKDPLRAGEFLHQTADVKSSREFPRVMLGAYVGFHSTNWAGVMA